MRHKTRSPCDDDAFGWIEHATPVAVTVVGQQTGWLRPLFAGDPHVKATFIDPSRYDLPPQAGSNPASTSEDLIVFDRWAPAVQPRRPAIYVAPPPVPWLSSLAGATQQAWDASEEKRPQWEIAGTHPVVQGVDPLTLKIDKARPYGAALTPVAVSARGTPLVYVADTEERRFVVLTFGPAESNLASAPASRC